jgi:hypothetical protein
MRALLLTLRACIANGYVRHPVASYPRLWSYPKCKAMRVREHGAGVADAMENVSHTGRERGLGPGFAGGRVPPNWSRTRRPPCFLLWTHGTCGF